MSIDLDVVKTTEAVSCLKTIIRGLNDLSENSTKEQIQEIQKAYYFLSALALNGDEFAEIVETALQGVAQEDISHFVSAGIKSCTAKSLQIFNASDAMDVTRGKDNYTFKCIEANKQSKDIFSNFDAYPIQDNEIVYLCYEDNSKERIRYKMKSPTGAEKQYNFYRDDSLDIYDDIFNMVKDQFHNEAWASDFEIQNEQRRAQLELIFGLAKMATEQTSSSSSSYFSFFKKASGQPQSNESSSSCLVM